MCPAEPAFQHQSSIEQMVPSNTNIRGWHGAAGVPGNAEGSEIYNVEAIVPEEQAVFAAELLINGRVTMALNTGSPVRFGVP